MTQNPTPDEHDRTDREGERSDDAEAQARQPGHRAGHTGSHAETLAHLLQDRSGRGRAGAQVEGDEDDGGEEEPERDSGAAGGAGVSVGHVRRP